MFRRIISRHYADLQRLQTKHPPLRARISGNTQLRNPDLEVIHGIPKQEEEEAEIGHIPLGIRPETTATESDTDVGQPV